jgi:hypothetical protein
VSKIAILALVLLIAPTIAQAGFFMQAYQLLFFCKVPLDQNQKQCDAFIAGVFDTIAAIQALPTTKGKPYCPPAPMTLPRLNDLVISYIETHKDRLQDSAATVVMDAMAEAYPCN